MLIEKEDVKDLAPNKEEGKNLESPRPTEGQGLLPEKIGDIPADRLNDLFVKRSYSKELKDIESREFEEYKYFDNC